MEGSLFATIKTQYEKLEKENLKLKLQLEAEQNSQERTRKDHEKQINQHLEEIMDLKKEIKHKDNKFAEWCEENKQLKDENEILKKRISNWVELSKKNRKLDSESHQKKGDYIMKLEEEIKQLKKQFYIPKKEPETGEDIPWTLADENKQLKGYINSLMTEDQKDICNGEAMEAGEPTLQTPKDWIDRIRQFLEERDELAEKVEDLEEELEAEKFYSKQLKDCNYEEYCELVGENKLIKEFEDLKNELGEFKKV